MKRLSLYPLLVLTLASCTEPTAPKPQDHAAPAVELTDPVSGTLVGANVQFFGTAADSAGVVRISYQLDGGAEADLAFAAADPSRPADSTRVAFAQYIVLSGGVHQLVVNAYDRAGNKSSATATYTADLAVPVIQVASPAAGAVVSTDTVRVRATVTDDHRLESAWFRLNGREATYLPRTTSAASASFDTLVTLAVGQNTITLTARDAAKNAGSLTVSITRASTGAATLDAIAHGPTHGCGLRGSAAYCWGANQSGQLGTGNTLPRDAPVPVAGGLTFTAVDAAAGRSCGVAAGGSLYCWGANWYSVLGIGTDSVFGHHAPRRVASSVAFSTVDAGNGNTTCALATSGEAYCWGFNREGQAGVPRSTGSCNLAGEISPCVRVPAAVQGGLRFAQISAGGLTTCALTAEGVAYCWGSVWTTAFETPQPVAGSLRFKSISAGFSHVCAVATSGQAYCWGRNDSGGLGDGTLTSRPDPAPVAGGLTFRSVGTGLNGELTCAATDGGAVYCWGGGLTAPAPLQGGLTFATLSADHLCGLTADRKAYCWDRKLEPAAVPGD